MLAEAKIEVSNFFEDVIVNDDDEALKKNRLELLQLLCKTFNNYINFSNIEADKSACLKPNSVSPGFC